MSDPDLAGKAAELDHFQVRYLIRMWSRATHAGSGQAVLGWYMGCSGQQPGLNCSVRSYQCPMPSRQRFWLKGLQPLGGSQHHSLGGLHIHSTEYLLFLPVCGGQTLSPSRMLISLEEALLRVFCCLLLMIFMWRLLTIQPMLTAAGCSACV